MKIRIKGNSLRYRLTQPEVAKLYSAGFLEERTAFAGETLVYAIETADGDQLSADFNGNRIVLRMPTQMIKALGTTDRVGFEEHSGPVVLLIEKDFVCLENTEEDQRDNYPNPKANC